MHSPASRRLLDPFLFRLIRKRKRIKPSKKVPMG